jgi:hypothetical protein
MRPFSGETTVVRSCAGVAGGGAPSSALLAADSNQAEQWLSNASATAQTEIVVRALRGGHKVGVTKRLSYKVLVGRARSKLRFRQRRRGRQDAGLRFARQIPQTTLRPANSATDGGVSAGATAVFPPQVAAPAAESYARRG